MPAPGELSATLFLELLDEEALRTWLPRLAGIERACELRIGSGAAAKVITSTPEEDHQTHLTREETTSAVHYVRFLVDDVSADELAIGPVVLGVNHPAYPDGLAGTVLAPATRSELAKDLLGE